ncbi:hypothetical protein [Microbacterium sp.]|uniref:hypothetical protein n=1 Tax=Microbacterium sp. TaxID=51671 RepID=UPI0039E4DC30
MPLPSSDTNHGNHATSAWFATDDTAAAASRRSIGHEASLIRRKSRLPHHFDAVYDG